MHETLVSAIGLACSSPQDAKLVVQPASCLCEPICMSVHLYDRPAACMYVGLLFLSVCWTIAPVVLPIVFLI